MTKYFLFFVFVLNSFVIQAVEVTTLYQASVEIASQSVGDKNQAIKEAMAAVIIKVGGNEKLLSNEIVQEKIKRYQHYVTKYRFERKQSINYLVVNFSESKINAIFKEANLPIWGNLRPKILVWVLEEDGLKRQFVLGDEAKKYQPLIDSISEQKGLPLSLVTEPSSVPETVMVADFWGRFEHPIKLASQPFEAEAIVVLRLSNSSLLPQTDITQSAQLEEHCQLLCNQQRLAIDWSFIKDHQRFSKRYYGSDKNELIKLAFSHITQSIYESYAMQTSDDYSMLIDVANIRSIEQYVAIVDFLTRISSVQQVQLIYAKGENKRFKLELLGSKQQLLASLKLNKKLQQFIDPLAAKSNEQIPVFYWKNE